jgi:flavorubredoxin
VKTGDRLSLGSKELVFIEAPMLHWPDSMFCYLTGEKILFSNDAFGQHYASEFMFNDLVEPSELFSECIKYYANILTPFSSFVKKKIEEVIAMDVPLSMICPSHGVIWRDNPVQIVNKYMEWAQNYAENQVTVIYDTMWNGTRRIAESIAEGLRHNDKNLTVKMYNCARSDKNDIVTEVFKSKAILVGSPTINRGILSSVAGLMEEIRGLSFKNKMAAAFCTYGWSGEGRATIETLLDNAGFKRLSDGPKILWYPTEESLSMCRSYGAMISAALKENHSKKG